MATRLRPNMNTLFSENSRRLASTSVMRCCREVGVREDGGEGGRRGVREGEGSEVVEREIVTGWE